MPCKASRALSEGLRYARDVAFRNVGSRIVAAGLFAAFFLRNGSSGAVELVDLYSPDPTLPPPTPPPISSHYLQYGVALAGEAVASAGEVCPTSRGSLPCILSGGGGLTLRVGYRTRGPWYIGGAYEFSRQDSENLLRLAILQQLRGELRYHLTRVTRTSPYVTTALGALVYGNEWGLDTWGLGSSLGLGLEFQLTPSLVLNIASNYRQLFFHRWTDSAGQVRASGTLDLGLAHIVALEFGFEIREPLPRW